MMHKRTETRLLGMSIFVDSCLGTELRLVHEPQGSYILIDQDIYDLLMIFANREQGFPSYWVDTQLTCPRSRMFKLLATQEFYTELCTTILDFKKDAIDMGRFNSPAPTDLLQCPLCQKSPTLYRYTIIRDMYDFDRMYYECVTNQCAFRPERDRAAVDEEFARLQWNTFVTGALNCYQEPCVGGEI